MTVGVEEEFLLVDTRSRELAAVAAQVLADAAGILPELREEIVQFQVETASPVCHTLADLREHLLRSRTALAEIAQRHGVRPVATGTPVLGRAHPAPLTNTTRYHRIAESFGALAETQTICGCHVHVGVPDPESGVQVSNHLRSWLPLLLAMSANSPFWSERDTRYASWRYLVWNRWPSAGPPPWLRSASHYETTLRTLLHSGAAIDQGMLYWDVRLSAKYPTVELRVFDIAATVDEAVLLAGVARAIAATALVGGVPAVPVPQQVLRAAMWRAARYGMEGTVLDPLSERLVPASTLVNHLLVWARPGLEANGDLEWVTDSAERLIAGGSGAARQRGALQRRGRLTDVVDLLVEQTAPGLARPS
ncbi:carboxylate-amine ligase [Goodfellowiella coeruleoviolacea]|uniref:Putative glutamate--cysteine ligase 2 n=2 Tax=Goodfellowiella coeruleoviolacea TaxID=334858 RepID=A0AAE3KIP3_9PSEU|nr:carboxylate-amine ligase [Goodfellowiella coeruleoviolacea]